MAHDGSNNENSGSPKGKFDHLTSIAETMPSVILNIRGVESPEVHPDGRVTFRLYAPMAGQVNLHGNWMKGHGEWLDSSVPMSKCDDGVWSVTLGPLDPDIYNYRLGVDGLATVDPANPFVNASERNHSSRFEIPGPEPLIHDIARVPHGTVQILDYWSETLGVHREMYVYTPPGYEQREDSHPVLYLLHGTTQRENGWIEAGRANVIIDNLIVQAKAKPMIVVMPYGRAYPRIPVSDGSLGNWGNICLFEQELLAEIIPTVHKRFRIHIGPVNSAIAGLSGGGAESLVTGLKQPGKFAWVAGFSAAIDPSEFDHHFAGLRSDPKSANGLLKLLWIGCGTDDHLYDANETFHQWLTALQVKHTYRRTSGHHTFMVWRRYLAELASLLFR
jgi:enterochelin esterase-like enzyme